VAGERSIVIALVAALALAVGGCGSSPSAQTPAGSGGRGDSATFTIDGRSISVTQSGSTSVKIGGAPELTYSGPLGCKGQYFTADFSDGIPMFFRYTSRDAYLLVGSDLYYLGARPSYVGSKLEWNTYTSGHQIKIEVRCPPPPRSGPLTGSGTPSACVILTAAIAAPVLHAKVGRPEFRQENPDLSYCAYRTSDTSFHADRRRLSVSLATALELTNLISWNQPTIAGLGDQARGGDPSIGLDVRKGKLGIEVTADLGSNATDATNLAAEEMVARELLLRLQ
jgi:hypothetical protein